MMMAARICQYTKNQCTVHLKWMTCIVYKLYLNKVAKNKQKRPSKNDGQTFVAKSKTKHFFKRRMEKYYNKGIRTVLGTE